MKKKRKIVGYIRVSTEKQDLDKQRHLLLEYANEKQLRIDEFIEAEISSRKSQKDRRIDEVLDLLEEGDLLLVAELSRLGREMLQVLNIINALSEKGVEIYFVRQPELSTAGDYGKLLLAIYGYFAEAERTFISMRVKQGLAAAKAKGVKLGRPKGSRNKNRVLDDHRSSILGLLEKGVDLANVRKIINPKLEKPISYNSYKYFVQRDPELNKKWQHSTIYNGGNDVKPKIYEFKIYLAGIQPQIWRRFRVYNNISFRQLHDVIQIVMGWENYHLFYFDWNGHRFLNQTMALGDESASAIIGDHISMPGSIMGYEYDFGDCWQHELVLEKVLGSTQKQCPVCTHGRRACPPEDVGGVWGYEALVKAMKAKRGADYRHYKEWLGGRYDPTAFDFDVINQELAELSLE